MAAGRLHIRDGLGRILALGLGLAFAIGALWAWRAFDERSALENLQAGFPTLAARKLRSWFQARLLSPSSTHLLMVALLRANSDPKAALEAAEDCLSRSGSVECAIGIAMAYEQMDRLDEAESALLTVLSGPTEYPDAHFRLGEVERRRHKVDLAISEYLAAAGYAKEDRERRVPLERVVSLLNEGRRFSETTPYLDRLFSASQGDWLKGIYSVAESYLGQGREHDFIRAMEAAESLREKSRVGAFYVQSNSTLYQRYHELKVSERKGTQDARR